MKSVQDIMRGRPPLASPLWSVQRAAEVMDEKGCRCLPVMQDGYLVGLVTERQLLTTHPNRLVADVMRREPATVGPQASLWQALEALPEDEEFLVVLERGHVLGVVSRADIQRELACYVCPLTGLPRSELLKSRAEQWLREGLEVAVIFLDMDDFRWVNKQHGHVVGDQVLQEVGRLLGQRVRPDRDVLGRYGGDEFAVVTLRPLPEAEMLAASMVEAVERARFGPDGVRLTVSAGVAGGRRQAAREGEPPGWTVDDLFNLASLASTRAKKTASAVSVATGHVVVEQMPASPPGQSRRAR